MLRQAAGQALARRGKFRRRHSLAPVVLMPTARGPVTTPSPSLVPALPPWLLEDTGQVCSSLRDRTVFADHSCGRCV
jgi:hypothetical protein